MAQGEEIDHLVVFERDEWTCGICGKAIDKRLRKPSWWCATLDHVRPAKCFSANPQDFHRYSNVQAAHYRCNQLKGDTDC